MRQSTAEYLLNALNEIEKSEDGRSSDGYTKEEVVEIIYEFFPDDEELSNQKDIDHRVDEAVRLLNAALGLSPEEAKKLSETVPVQLQELVSRLDETKRNRKEGKLDTLQGQHNQVVGWIERQKKARIERKEKEGVEISEGAAQFFQRSKEVSEKPEVLGITLSPTAISLEKFASRIISAPLKFIIDLGSSEIHKASPSVSTAVWLMAQGITSSSIAQIAAAARTKGVSLSYRKLKKLEDLIREHEGITIYKILQKARELQFTQADEAALIQVFLPSEEERVSGKQSFTISSSITQEGSYLPGETYSQGFAGSLAQSLVGKASSEILKRTLGKTAQGLVIKGAAKLGVQIAAGAVAPIVGNIIAFIGTELISLGKRFVSWLSRFLTGKDKDKEGAWLLPVGLMAGGFLLMPISAPLGIAAFGLGGLSALGQLGGLSGATANAAGFFQNVINGITGIIIPSIAKPIIISLIAIPIVIAFIVFIINAGAYVVPPGGPLPLVPGQPTPPTINASGSCPIPGGVILCGSYGSSYTCQHGDNSYWSSQGQPYCRWSLPSSDGANCSGAPYIGNLCYDSASQCTWYGFAADVMDPSRQCNLPVYLPYLNGKQLDWTLVWPKDNAGGWGYGGLLRASDGTNTYEMYFTHLNAYPTPGKSGDVAGTLWCNIATPHVHVELKINGQYVRPEFLCTGGSSTTKTAYVAQGSLNDVQISTLSEISSPELTCSWSARHGLVGATNANFFTSSLAPVGWAGYQPAQDFGCGTSCATTVFNGSVISPYPVPPQLGRPDLAVSGLNIGSSPTSEVNRTALGVKSGTVYLVVAKNVTNTELQNFMVNQLGVSGSMLLDSGGSSTFCDGSNASIGNQRLVPVNIGLRNGTVSTYQIAGP